MANLSKKALLQQFIKETVDLRKLQKADKQQFIISFVGLTGVGKSTIAHLLADKSELPLFSHDDVRQFLEKHSLDKNDREMVEWLSLERATHLMQSGVNFILDGDIVSYYKVLIKRLKQVSGELLLINVICDLDEVMARLEKRKYGEKQIFGNVNYSPADFNTYFQRRFLHTQGKYPQKFFATINNTHNSEEQVDELWFKIKMWVKKKEFGLK